MYKYVFINKNSEYTFLLLHGTGGNEYSLVELANEIDDKVNILGIKGNVDEFGSSRFFKREGLGKYDIENLVYETNNLDRFLDEICLTEPIDRNKIIGIGFSNGANIMQSLFQLKGKRLYSGIMLSPSYLQKEVAFSDLTNLPLFISQSTNDPYTTESDAKLLERALISSKADLTSYWFTEGHTVTNEVLKAVINFWNNIK